MTIKRLELKEGKIAKIDSKGRVLEVEHEDGRKVLVPRAKVELIEE